MTDPQNDVKCRDCGALTQHVTEICDDCRTPAGRLVTALLLRGVASAPTEDSYGVLVGDLWVDAGIFGWEIGYHGGSDLGGMVEAAADAAAAIVQAPGLRAEPVTVADVIGGEAANALRDIATIIGCPADVDPLTDLDGLVRMVRGLAERAETLRAVTADRDALCAEIDARGPAILVTR